MKSASILLFTIAIPIIFSSAVSFAQNSAETTDLEPLQTSESLNHGVQTEAKFLEVPEEEIIPKPLPSLNLVQTSTPETTTSESTC